MSNPMMYAWILIGGFVFMTVLFFIAEREVKVLKRKLAEKDDILRLDDENDKFDSVYRQMEIEAQALRNTLDQRFKETMDEFDRIHQRIDRTEEKRSTPVKKSRKK